MEGASPERLCVEDELHTEMKTQLTLPPGACGDLQRLESSTTNAISISALSTAPPGLTASPMSNDVAVLKNQVEFCIARKRNA